MTQAHGLSPHELAKLRTALARHAPALTRVDLFGSRATGRAKAYSDLDIVLVGPKVDEALADRVFTELNELTLPFRVDVLFEGPHLPAALRAHIEQVRRPLFDFEAQAT